MAESTLSISYEDLGRSTAFYLGFGRKATTGEGLTASQSANVLAANNAGYRRFLLAHDWEFVTPRTTITLWATKTGTAAAALTTTVTATAAKFFPSMVGHSIVFLSGNSYTITGYTSSTVITVSSTAAADSSTTFTVTSDGVYRLPDDFGGMDSTEMAFEANNGDDRVIQLTSEPMVVDSWQFSTTTARPSMAAIRPLSNSAGTGQRNDLVVAPIPDTDYVVSYRYNVLPNALTTGLYPYGGMAHGETIRMCCLAAAEQMFRSHENTQRQEADRMLAASIRKDSASGPGRLGLTRGRAPGRVYEPRITGGLYHGVAIP